MIKIEFRKIRTRKGMGLFKRKLKEYFDCKRVIAEREVVRETMKSLYSFSVLDSCSYSY